MVVNTSKYCLWTKYPNVYYQVMQFAVLWLMLQMTKFDIFLHICCTGSLYFSLKPESKNKITAKTLKPATGLRPNIILVIQCYTRQSQCI